MFLRQHQTHYLNLLLELGLSVAIIGVVLLLGWHIYHAQEIIPHAR